MIKNFITQVEETAQAKTQRWKNRLRREKRSMKGDNGKQKWKDHLRPSHTRGMYFVGSFSK